VLQQHKITGTVTDGNTGESLPGVNVVLDGTTVGVVTNADGNYTLEVPENGVVTFSYVGYTTEKVQLMGQTKIDIKLMADVKKLDEVVVVGYGTQRKSDITGSVTSVAKSRLTELPVTNFAQAIEGSVAGVNITQGSSIPGSTPTTSIRGINSITANTSPFLVVDGIPFSGSFNDINPNDVSSIEILKDASAVAIYGTRGANGVILITTKRGNTGKPSIRYSGYAGTEDFAHILKPRDGASYVQKWADFNTQTGSTPQYPVPNLAEVANYNDGKTTDWLKEISQTGVIQDHNLSISGGAKDIKYFVSGDYLKDKGNIKGFQYHRATFRSNLDVNATNYLSMGASVLINNNNSDGGRANLLNATAMSPYGSVKDALGNYIIFPMAPDGLYLNPLLGLTTNQVNRSTNLGGNVYAELAPSKIKGLKYRINASYTYLPTRTASYTGRLAGDVNGTATSFNSEDKTWIIENIISYTKDFDKHHVDFTGLYSAQQENYFASSMGSNTFINDILSFNDMGAGGTTNPGGIPNVSQTGTYAWQSNLESQMGRINYSYDSRYLLTITARRDGYSAFGSGGKKYGIFPSVALGWNINKENFLKDVSFIDNLKLRFSYGKVGNQAIGVTQTNSTEGAVKYPFGGIAYTGVVTSVLGNPNLHWESTTSSNIGVDFSAWNNRVNLTVDAYKTHTNGLLLRRNIPQITGYTSMLDNIGEMQNTGIEVTLSSVNLKIGDFRWESNINFSMNRNKIIDLFGDKTDDIVNSRFIGQPLNVIYNYKMIGVWQVDEDPSGSDPTAKPGDLKFKDISGPNGVPDGKIDANDRIVLGQTDPKWRGGMTNTFTFKNLHLSILIQTSQGAIKNNNDLTYADEQGRRNTPAEVGYWTPENKSQTRPSLAYNAATRGYGFPTNNSYTRIKDVTLSYVFSKALLQKIRLQGLTVYASGKNLYTFTKWIGWDPESTQDARGAGNWTNNYPFTRQIVIGLNVALQ
jgi:TonB-linked SusC/RagA family outer membrane protein